jgi:hypothetical protein
MQDIQGFSQISIDLVNEMLYAEGQPNPYEGKCGQKKLQEQQKKPRTPAQEQADKARAQQQTGRNSISSAVRSQAAKKAAETRKRCKGGTPGKTSTTTTT